MVNRVNSAAGIAAVITAGVLCLLLVSFQPGCGGGAATTAPASTRASGLGFDSAIAVGSIGEELDVMNGITCGGDGFFRKTHVEVVEKDGRHYDIIDTQCTASSETRTFYFDVSSCFPCPD
ncbi:MAG: hypothetical protein ACYC5F_09890 [Thermoleophilia bacterium]